MPQLWVALIALVTLSLASCGYSTLQVNDKQIKAARPEVVNQYQQRAKLVPKLVNSVKGFATQKEEVLLGATSVRAKCSGIQKPQSFSTTLRRPPNSRLPRESYRAPRLGGARADEFGSLAVVKVFARSEPSGRINNSAEFLQSD